MAFQILIKILSYVSDSLELLNKEILALWNVSTKCYKELLHIFSILYSNSFSNVTKPIRKVILKGRELCKIRKIAMVSYVIGLNLSKLDMSKRYKSCLVCSALRIITTKRYISCQISSTRSLHITKQLKNCQNTTISFITVKNASTSNASKRVKKLQLYS